MSAWDAELTPTAQTAMTPKVTVYTVCRNYGRYVGQTVESVLAQTYESWEYIIINDGSTDSTREVVEHFKANPKIQIYHQGHIGLPKSCNRALKLARGEYFIRLDADDFLEENALLVMVNVLDRNPDVGLVYSDYFTVNEEGEIIGLKRRKKAYKEDKLLDIPAHGACSLIRRSALLRLGQYREDISCQDGYDLWIRLRKHYKVANVNLPLFFYRKHAGSLTTFQNEILRTRQRVKRLHVQEVLKAPAQKIMAIVPIRGSSPDYPRSALQPLAGQPLIDYTLNAIVESGIIDRAVVSSDSEEILQYVSSFPKVCGVLRTLELAKPHTRLEPTLLHALREVKLKEGYVPDAVMLLLVNTPLRESRHIQAAVDTMTIFDTDTVISVRRDRSFFHQHHENGLKPLFEDRLVRLERNGLYAENGAIYLSRTPRISERSILGEKIGHILMTDEESFRIYTEFDFWLVERIIERRRTLAKDSNEYGPV